MADLSVKKRRLTVLTKILLDFLFYVSILATITLPFSIRWAGKYLPRLVEHYWTVLVVYIILGIFATVLIFELQKIFRTVLKENCFVQENVKSLRRMGNVSFLIVVMSVMRCVVYPTRAIGVVILVFIIAGLFSKVLAYVFEEAVRYKEENDMTI